MTNERRDRIEELSARARYSAALDGAAAELSELLGVAIDQHDAVSMQIADTVLAASIEQDRSHYVWHRIWGARLRAKFLVTTRRLARLLADERAVVVWQRSPAVGFEVAVEQALRSLPEHIGPDSDKPRPPRLRHDVLLVTDDGSSGLQFGYSHLARSDEYALLSWGRFARQIDT